MKTPFKQVFKSVVLSGSGPKTQMLRDKGKDPYKSLLRSLIVAFFSSLLYTLFFIFFDYSQVPNAIFFVLGLFFVMWSTTLAAVAFQVIFASKDLLWYRPLPVDVKTILLAKMIYLGLAANGMFIPLLTSLLKFSHDQKIALWPVVGLLVSLGTAFMVYVVVGLFLMGISSKHIPSKIQRLLIRGQSLITVFITLAAIFYSKKFSIVQGDPYDVVVDFLAHPMLFSSGFFVVSALFLLITGKVALPKLYDRIGRIDAVSRGGKRKGKGTLLRYNLGLLTEPKIFSFTIDGLFLNAIMFFSVALNLRSDVIAAPMAMKPFIAAQVALVSVWLYLANASIRTTFLSLDGEAGRYFQALPISLEERIREKVKVLTGVLFIQEIILLLVMHLFFQLRTPKILLLNLFLALISAYVGAKSGLRKDVKRPFYDWTNPTDIRLSGGSRGKLILTLFGEMILLTIFLVGLNILAGIGVPLGILYGVIYGLWAAGILIFALLGA